MEDEVPLLLCLSTDLQCRPGENSGFRWALTHRGRGTLADIRILAEFDCPGPCWTGQAHAIPSLAPGAWCKAGQGYTAPASPGDYMVAVRVSCRDSQGRLLEFRNRDPLWVRFEGREGGGRLVVNAEEGSLVNIRDLVDHFSEITVNARNGSLARLMGQRGEEGRGQARWLIEQDLEHLVPVPLAQTSATQPGRQREMDGATGYTPLLAALRACDRGDLYLRMSSLASRDISASRAGLERTDTVRIGDSLSFELRADREGYLTVVNLGTSGGAFLLIPNAACGIAESYLRKGRYRLPGDGLMPEYDFTENGPPGWEHLATVLSDRPLVPSGMARTMGSENPFHSLSVPESSLLASKVSDPSISKSVDLLSFRVIEGRDP